MGITTEDLYFKPSLRVINDEQISRIYAATLEVLERTGIKMTHPKGLEILAGAGAKIQNNRVRIPSWMVEDAIAKASHRLVLGNQKAGGKKFEDRLQGLTLKKMEHQPRELPKETIKELDKMQASWK